MEPITTVASEFNKLPKPSDYKTLYLLAQQAFENGFRGTTMNEIVVYLSKNLPEDLVRSEFIYEEATPAIPLTDPGRNASMFAPAGTYTTPSGTLELSKNFNVIGWNGSTWTKLFEIDIEVPPAINKVLPWTGATPAGEQRLYNGQLWTAKVDTLENEAPVKGDKWEPEIDTLSGKTALDTIEDYGILIAKAGDPVDIAGISWQDKSFIKSDGNIGGTALDFSASGFIDLPGVARYQYTGGMNANHCIGFFRIDDSFISAFVASVPITTVEFIAPPDTQKIKVTCATDKKSSFSIVLKENIVKSKVEDMLLNEQLGVLATVFNEDGVVSSAEVLWQDGTGGALTMTNYNEPFISYDGYEITYLGEEIKKLVQPPVTRDVDGNITSKPNKYII